MKILAFPRDANPYQELLYMPMRKEGVIVDYLEGPTPSHTLNILALPWLLVGKRLQGYTIFHLHWVATLTLPWAGKSGRRLMQWYFRLFLWLLGILGYKLIWTAHNALPHSPVFADDQAMRAILYRYANAVIAHSTSAKAKLQAVDLPTDKVTIIPHGNYVGVYPHTISRTQARAQLAIPTEAFVVTFVGFIEPYKNVPMLLDAAVALHTRYPHLHIIVAGACKDAALNRQLQKAKRILGDRLHLHAGYIAPEDMQRYFAAADIAAYPFKEITTSGSLLLGLTFGLPIIAPRIGAVADMPAGIGFLYDPSQPHALEQTLVVGKQAAGCSEVYRFTLVGYHCP
jgi:glycosyltransferase involved in cell wall biosynthesis